MRPSFSRNALLLALVALGVHESGCKSSHSSGGTASVSSSNTTNNSNPTITTPNPAPNTPTSTVVTPAPPTTGSITVTPGNKFGYAINGTGNDIQPYLLDPKTGIPSPSGSTVAAGTGAAPIWAGVAATGSFLFVCTNSGNTVLSFTINPSNGQLTAAGSIACGNGPFALVVDPQVRFVFVANATDATISAYTVNGQTGVLAAAPVAAAGADADALAMDSTGSFLYCGNYSDNTVSSYTVSATASLTVLAPPITCGNGPEGVAVDPFNRFLYTANYTDGTISTFAIAKNGALANVPPDIQTGAQGGTNGLAVDPTGQFVYAVNGTIGAGGTNDVATFSISPSTGALTPVTTNIGAGTDPYMCSLNPTGKELYVANFTSGDISVFDIAATGSLTAVLPNVTAGGASSGTTCFAVSPK